VIKISLNKTHKQFVDNIYQLVKNEYTVLGNYINSRTKILMKHNICGHEWYIKPYSFLSGQRCPKCAKNHKRTHEEYCKLLYDLRGDDIEILEEYDGSNIKKLFRHKCGYEWQIEPRAILAGIKCPNCSGKKHYTFKEIKEILYNLVGNEYEIIGEYVNHRTKVLFRHNKCGNEWFSTPRSFINNNTRCPKCKQSKGERRIEEFLINNNIKYECQYSTPECKNHNPLEFDIIIYKSNNEIILIEYQGRQHFEPVEFWGGIKNLLYIQQNDKIKYDYCLSNNIPLIYINYWEYNQIENILEKELINSERTQVLPLQINR
jgi:predicted Zn-ribbon and HTH transcriptional regulator